MTVSYNTIAAKVPVDFFKSLGKKVLKHQKSSKKCLKNPGRALEKGGNVVVAFASRSSPNAALSTLPHVTNFYHTGNSLFSGKFV